MAKILVFQHVPFEPLGTLDPLVRSRRHRIRYVNFHRDPEALPDINGYDALIILGGPMNIGEELSHPHLEIEKQVIREAASQDKPILGICLGAQLIASALGSHVYPAREKEIGWTSLRPTHCGRRDPLIAAFNSQEKVFQLHGYTFDLPRDAELLVTGEQVANQAFRIKQNIYGFQFHLEANLPLIKRWLKMPPHDKEIAQLYKGLSADDLWQESLHAVSRSQALSQTVFERFLDLVPKVHTRYQFVHRHFKLQPSLMA